MSVTRTERGRGGGYGEKGVRRTLDSSVYVPSSWYFKMSYHCIAHTLPWHPPPAATVCDPCSVRKRSAGSAENMHGGGAPAGQCDKKGESSAHASSTKSGVSKLSDATYTALGSPCPSPSPSPSPSSPSPAPWATWAARLSKASK
jgi:hypothetical protein